MRSLNLLMVSVLAASAAEPLAPATSEDEFLVVEASAYIDKAAVIAAIGKDPAMDLVVVKVKLSPRGETKIQVNFDDFTLISRKDGQRSQPLAPSEIAGAGALVVTSRGQGSGGGGVFNPNRGPIWGGVPGTSSRPRRIGGEDQGSVVGTSPAAAEAVVENGGKASENPLLDMLKQKVLPQKEVNEPVTGLLYFFLEGKHKMKQLELMYKSPAGRLILDFER